LDDFEKYKRNIYDLRQNIEKVCRKAGRNPGEILLVAATKYADAEQVNLISELGLKDFGENRADQLVEKYNHLRARKRWHFIGHLQSRKAKIVVPLVEYIHSIDKTGTLEKVNKAALEIGKIQKVLIEINISGESAKYGMEPEELYDFLKRSEMFGNIRVEGLMTMAPFTEDMDVVRKVFRNLRLLRDRTNKKIKGAGYLKELSMGMSNDYRVAIEEGATMLRIGSDIFK
jgi:pyridoxal phosphate enzyme (YggS family)